MIAKVLIMVAALLCASLAHATPSCEGESDDCTAVGRWNVDIGLGLGLRTNPVADGKNIPLVLIPHVSYYGKRFFLDNLEIGYTLLETDRHTLSAIAAPGYDRVFFYRSDLQNIFVGGSIAGSSATTPPGTVSSLAPESRVSPRPRHTTYLVGGEWTFNYGKFEGQVNVLHEVTGEHSGQEARIAIAAPLFSERVSRNKWSITTTLGGTWKSAKLVDYYYGEPQVYAPGSAFNPFLKLRYARPLTEHLNWVTFVHWEYLADSIARSPVIVEHSVTTAFLGVVYAF